MLREITNTIQDHDEKIIPEKNKKFVPLREVNQSVQLNKQESIQRLVFDQCVQLNTFELSFGPCLPSTIHQRTLILTLTKDLPKPVLFCMQIICHNQKLNNLPEFVFAIKKDRQFEFTDCYRFRLNKRGSYNFIIGVKTPIIMVGQCIESNLKVSWEFLENGLKQHQRSAENDCNNLEENASLSFQRTCYHLVKLKQQIYTPQIQCTKQLMSIDDKQLNPIRVLKFSQIKTKLKKQVKIPFMLKTQCKITLINQLISLQHQYSQLEKNSIEILPRQLALTGNGVFLMTFKFNFTQEMAKYLQDLQMSNSKLKNTLPSYTLRRVMTMKISQTNIFFHFPIEVTFFLGNKRNGNDSVE